MGVYSTISPELIKKYSVSGPRYTSYPTAVEFSGAVQEPNWRELVREDSATALRESGATASVYVHIPFCPQLCWFCACTKVITRDYGLVERYLKTLSREFREYGTMLGSHVPAVEQIHWGGGSPNSLKPEDMAALHRLTLEVFPHVLPDADVSIELDPRETTREQVAALAEAGFNRFSFGIQDFTAEVQEAVHRVQSFERTKDLVDYGRARGIRGVNVDLIYGLPKQTRASFRSNVERVLELRPDRVAMYGYAHVTWLKKSQKVLEKEHLPSPDERIELFVEGLRAFTEAGYEYIGFDHFALPGDALALARRSGKLNRNFMGYTTHRGARIYGFGMSSISSLPGGFAQNAKELPEYERRIASSGLAIERGVLRSVDDRLRWEVIERLLCGGRVDIGEIERQWGIAFAGYFADALRQLEPLRQDGLMEISPGALQLTELGRLFSRNAAMAFDAYLAKHRAESKSVFSQAV